MVKGRGAGYSRAEYIRVESSRFIVSSVKRQRTEQEEGKTQDKHARCMIRRRKDKGQGNALCKARQGKRRGWIQ